MNRGIKIDVTARIAIPLEQTTLGDQEYQHMIQHEESPVEHPNKDKTTVFNQIGSAA